MLSIVVFPCKSLVAASSLVKIMYTSGPCSDVYHLGHSKNH